MSDSSLPVLFLVAHGVANATTNGAVAEDPVHAQAAALRRTDLFAAVETGFLRDRTALRETFDAVTSLCRIVVPFFTANGYFTRNVLPDALGCTTPAAVGNNTIISDALGTWQGIDAVVADLARAACRRTGWIPEKTALLLAGHGNPRDGGAARALARVGDGLRKDAVFREVATGFIEQQPGLDIWQQRIKSAQVVVVPFLMARGGHLVDDIPRLVGLPRDHGGRVHAVRGRDLLVTGPLGAAPQLADLIAQRVREGIGKRGPDRALGKSA